jgi:hypothetical protein
MAYAPYYELPMELPVRRTPRALARVNKHILSIRAKKKLEYQDGVCLVFARVTMRVAICVYILLRTRTTQTFVCTHYLQQICLHLAAAVRFATTFVNGRSPAAAARPAASRRGVRCTSHPRGRAAAS